MHAQHARYCESWQAYPHWGIAECSLVALNAGDGQKGGLAFLGLPHVLRQLKLLLPCANWLDECGITAAVCPTHPLSAALCLSFVCRRLKTVSPGKPLVVGSYAYLDGELHVRLSLAMDAIVKGLTEARESVMVRTACRSAGVAAGCLHPRFIVCPICFILSCNVLSAQTKQLRGPAAYFVSLCAFLRHADGCVTNGSVLRCVRPSCVPCYRWTLEWTQNIDRHSARLTQ